jgi:predicted porin
MKKTLIALAAIAAVSSAMADVSITGYVDRGLTNVNNTNAQKNLTTVGSSAGTTGVFIKGSESLTGGLNAMFSVETDFADNGGTTQSTYTPPSGQYAGFANGEVFVGLASKSFGSFKFGAPNSFMLDAVVNVGSPSYGTGVGSAYSQTAFSIFNGYGTGGSATAPANIVTAQTQPGTLKQAQAPGVALSTVNAGVRDIRLANTIQFQSPDFSGFKIGIGFTPQNNNVTGYNAYTSATAATTSNTYTDVGNTVGATEYNLRYTNASMGLDAVYDTIKYTVGSNNVGTINAGVASAPGNAATNYNSVVGGISELAQNETIVHNYTAVSYAVMPTLTLNAGYGTTTSGDNAYASRGTQFGATYTMGQWDLMGMTAQVTDSGPNTTTAANATSANRSLQSVGANYNFSKTTRAYARYETVSYNTATSFTGSQQTRYALGLSIKF